MYNTLDPLDVNFEVLQKTQIFYIGFFIIREPQFTIPDLKNLNLKEVR
jgi:hypothetical protein